MTTKENNTTPSLAEVKRKRAAANKEANRIGTNLIKRGGPFTEADFAALGRVALLSIALDLRAMQIGNANTAHNSTNA